MDAPRTVKRRAFLINPGFQLRFLAYVVGSSLVVIAAIYGALSYFFWKFARFGEGMQLGADHIYYTFLQEQRAVMGGVFLVLALAVVVILSVAGLLFSHKIAGPIHRLKKHLKAAADTGTYEEVKFRKGDFFPELAEAYNRQIPGRAGRHNGSGGLKRSAS